MMCLTITKSHNQTLSFTTQQGNKAFILYEAYHFPWQYLESYTEV